MKVGTELIKQRFNGDTPTCITCGQAAEEVEEAEEAEELIVVVHAVG
jgi:hypothetical protein